MSDELEIALEKQLKEARAELEEASKQSERYQEEADAVMAKARKERTRLLGLRDDASKEAEAKVHRLLRTQKVLRGEPLVAKLKKSDNGTPQVTEEAVLAVKKAIEEITADDPDKEFIVSEIHKTLPAPKMAYAHVPLALDVLREREEVRKSGQGRRGANKVQLYKLLKGDK